ncbi:MAG: plasmid partitioning protein RepA [Roseibium sp.]|uniref:plasmid partitioning protein RepA n=1 Tax=Roseibium sp. TaxID=1936156 RepID=UPI003299F24F
MISRDKGTSVFGQMAKDGEIMSAALDHQSLRSLAPGHEKVLRSFTAPEVAKLLGITPTYLRNLHHKNRIPLPEGETAGRRTYTAAEIYAIREELAVNAKDPLSYLPGRREGDGLQVISTVIFKGGSSKTTLTCHAVQKLALSGYRVLAVDLDPQASLSTIFGLRPEIELFSSGSVYDAIRYEDPVPMRDIIRKTYFHNIDLAPASLMLSEFDTETPVALRKKIEPPFYLRLDQAIKQVEVDYDLVVIDCAPQMSYLTMAAMIASTGIVVPVVPNMIDVASLAQFMRMSTELLKVIHEAGHHFDYKFMRYLITRFIPSDAPQAQMAVFLRVHFEDRVMTEPFLMSTAISDAGLTNNTLYEMNRSDFHRNTYDRAIESINKVVEELERDIWKAWGRS